MTTETPRLRVLEGGGGQAEAPLSHEALFRRYGPYVARIGLRMLGRESDVDDLLQEVFLAAYKQRDQVRNEGAIKHWLATIAVRTARRQLRRRKVRAFVGLDTGSTEGIEIAEAGVTPEQRALLAKVYEVLDTMGVEQRLAWTLRHVEGEKLEQVAARCGCSLATAKRRIAAAQARLQAEFSHG